MESNSTGIERRSEPRHSTHIRVMVAVGQESLGATLTNISGGGLEIQVSRPVNPGTSMTVSLVLDSEFKFMCKAIWTLGEYIDKKWIYRVGGQTGVIIHKNGQAVAAQDKLDLVNKILPLIRQISTDQENTIKKVA
jgi:hypothetical protein